MCSHYEGVRDAQVLRKLFQVDPPADFGKEFTDRFFASRARQPSGEHEFG